MQLACDTLSWTAAMALCGEHPTSHTLLCNTVCHHTNNSSVAFEAEE
jgi:hypothetical protein